MKSLFAALLFITLLSCQSSPKSVSLETFTDFPAEIDGCSCYFSLNKSDFDKGVYIYMDDYMDLAFVKMNGELITFSKFLNDESNYEESEWIFENYKLLLEIAEEGTLDETTQYTGNIKIMRNGVTLYNQDDLVGECGC